jgi:hypothetical protein
VNDFLPLPGWTYAAHCKKFPYDVYIGRPSKWANPFTHKSLSKTQAQFQVGSRKEAIEKYESHLLDSGLIQNLEELRGKVLGCWCCNKPSNGFEKNFICHGQVLAKYLNSELKNKQNKLI